MRAPGSLLFDRCRRRHNVVGTTSSAPRVVGMTRGARRRHDAWWSFPLPRPSPARCGCALLACSRGRGGGVVWTGGEASFLTAGSLSARRLYLEWRLWWSGADAAA